MSGPIAFNFFSKKNADISSFDKTATTVISPMNLSLANSTKHKVPKPGVSRKNKLIEHKKAKMSYEIFKKRYVLEPNFRYTETRSCSNSNETKRRNQEVMKTRAQRFIEKDLSFQYKIEGKPNKKKIKSYSHKKNLRNSWEKIITHPFMDLNFCTEGANSSHFDRYFIGKKIGQGAYAEVRAGVNSHNNKNVAIKIYDKNNLKDSQK